MKHRFLPGLLSIALTLSLCTLPAAALETEDAKALLPQLVRPDATFLVKASRGMELEELTGALLELTRDPGEG